MIRWTVLALCALAVCGLTALIRRYARGLNLIDVPNARSSHGAPMPRGGGAAMAIGVTLSLLLLPRVAGIHALPPAVVLAAVLVALIGLIDDRGHLPPAVRLVGQTVAAVMAVETLAATEPGGWIFETMSVTTRVVAVLFLVWFINLTNFMDGIDGLAGAQTLAVCVAGAVLQARAGHDWTAPAIVAAAALGFLVWNWPPARIFMGDTGSGFAGFLAAVFTLQAFTFDVRLGTAWLILSAIFVTDSGITLLRRALRRQRLTQAHRTHAYQHLALAWRSHRRVTAVALAINILWLAPLALAVGSGVLPLAIGIVIAYAPLAALAFAARAGLPTWTDSRQGSASSNA